MSLALLAAVLTLQTPGVDARGLEILSQVRTAYGTARTFDAQMTVGDEKTETRVDFAFERPSKVRLIVQQPNGRQTIVSDGRDLYVAHSGARNRYLRRRLVSREAAPVEAALFGQVPVLFTARLLAGRAPIEPADIASLTVEPGTLEGENVDVLKVVRKAAQEGAPRVRHTLWISQGTPRLRQVETVVTGPGGEEVARENLTRRSRLDAGFRTDPFTFARRGREVQELFPTYDDTIALGQLPMAFTGKDLAGDPVALSQYAGRPVLLVLWSVAEEASRNDLLSIKALHDTYKSQGFEVIAISTDPLDREAEVREFVKANGLAFPVVQDGQGLQTPLAARYRVTAVPFRLLVGRNGRIFSVNPSGVLLEVAVKAASRP